MVGSVASHLSDSALKYPEVPALVSGAKKTAFAPLSFAELDHTVDYAVGELVQSGIKPGEKTLLFVNPGPRLIIWAFALFRLGAIPVVIDPGMGIQSFLGCIKRTRPSAMVGISRAFWLSRLLPKSFQSVKNRCLVRPGSFGTGDKQNSTSNFEAQPNDLAAIVFTSGSTGSPKGVRYLHKTFNAQIDALRSIFGMMPGETDLTTLPIFGLFNPALGITSVLPEMNPRCPANANPAKLVESILEYGVTSAFASPVVGKKVASFCQNQRTKLSKMNRFFLAGAPVPPSLVEILQAFLPQGQVIVPYGATEALPVSWTYGDRIIKNKNSTLKGLGSLVGSPVPGARVTIVPSVAPPLPDFPENYSGLERGMVGEICVSGPMVTAGYDRMPGATCDARFKIGDHENHRMGDLGYLDKDGNLRFLGRKAECVITPGGPLETERCEPGMNELPYVNRCALIGLGSAPNQEPCLIVEPSKERIRSAGENALRNEIFAELKTLFPQFKINRILFEKKIPVDARHNAKIHRLYLAKKWSSLIARKPKLGIPV